MDDLFDFSGGAETIAPTSKHKRRETNDKATAPAPSKQNATLPEIGEDMTDEDDMSSDEGNDQTNGAGPSHRPRKRARKHEPAPVVLDEVETQVKRELPVNAGLSATSEAEAGQSLLLTHQVSSSIVFLASLEETNGRFPKGPTPSGCATSLQLYSHLSACLPSRTRSCLSLQTRSLPTSFGLCYRTK